MAENKDSIMHPWPFLMAQMNQFIVPFKDDMNIQILLVRTGPPIGDITIDLFLQRTIKCRRMLPKCVAPIYDEPHRHH